MNLHAALFKISLYNSFLVQTMSDEFLRKLYKLSDGEYKSIDGILLQLSYRRLVRKIVTIIFKKCFYPATLLIWHQDEM